MEGKMNMDGSIFGKCEALRTAQKFLDDSSAQFETDRNPLREMRRETRPDFIP